MLIFLAKGRRGQDHMVVGFITTYAISAITTKVVSSNPVHGEMYSIQYYKIKFVSDLRQWQELLFLPLSGRHAKIMLR
jgi:hypothetical protein